MEDGAVEVPAAPVVAAPSLPSSKNADDLTASIEDGLRRLTNSGAGVAFAEDGERLARVLTEIASQLGKHDAKLVTLATAVQEKAGQQEPPAEDPGARSDEVRELRTTLEQMGARMGKLEKAAEAADERAKAAEAKLETAARAVDYLQEQTRAANARAKDMKLAMEANGKALRTKRHGDRRRKPTLLVFIATMKIPTPPSPPALKTNL